MLKYALKRFLWVTTALALLSFVVFITIELPPGSFVQSWGSVMRDFSTFEDAIDSELAFADFETRFALDGSFMERYSAWLRNAVFGGDWGLSMEWDKPVGALIYERFCLTLAIAVPTVGCGWLLAASLGTVLARRKSTLDVLSAFACRVSRCIPPFLIALVVMWAAMSAYERNMGGLFSEEYVLAAWSWAKVGDLMGHVWLPILILFLGSAGQGTLVMRAAMVRELGRSYVDGARARGVAEGDLLRRYPLRVALGEFLEQERFALTRVVSSCVLVAMVLSLQTAGPMLLRALTSQDMYLGSAFLMPLGAVCIVATALLDVLRAAIDPRLRTTALQRLGDPVVGR